MSTDTYDLAELCDLADVTPRTVRYYVQQGLLPSPGTRGPGARYDRGHLERLQLVKRLQREHLPLAEIRARLGELGDAAVTRLLEEPDRADRHGSALEYVRGVLSGRPDKRTRTSVVPTVSEPAAIRPPRTPSHREAALQIAADESNGPGPSRSTWERVSLAPDVELHVRRPLSRHQNKQVDRLIEHARTLFPDPS